jgi:hypothetical protein
MSKFKLDTLKSFVSKVYQSINNFYYNHPVASRLIVGGTAIGIGLLGIAYYKDFENVHYTGRAISANVVDVRWAKYSGNDVLYVDIDGDVAPSEREFNEIPGNDVVMTEFEHNYMQVTKDLRTDVYGDYRPWADNGEIRIHKGGEDVESKFVSGKDTKIFMITGGYRTPTILSRAVKATGYISLISGIGFCLKTLNPNRGLMRSEIDNCLETDSSIVDETNTEKPEAWYRGKDVMFLVEKKEEELIPLTDEEEKSLVISSFFDYMQKVDEEDQSNKSIFDYSGE